MKRFIWLLCGFFLFPVFLVATDFQQVKDGPIHEAYIMKEFGTLLIETVPNQPPPRINESAPSSYDSQAVWIPGYWAWSQKYSQFLWVSGIWRRSPPGFQWISGYWKQNPEGWIWIRGFWSNKKEDALTYINDPPPDPIDEQISLPPAHAENYLWIRGYWNYDVQKQEYVWLCGRWEHIDPHWEYSPAHYIWREKGYVLVSSFWDWPLENRGLSFSAIYINPDGIDKIIYEPFAAMPHLEVMHMLFPDWPDYSYLFQYHYYFHKDSWSAWGAVPPWWDWTTWWCFTSIDAWWLWWWWTHPGYPQPFWLNDSLANMISPPPPFVVKLMESTKAPIIVTTDGVVGVKKILGALTLVTGKQTPILPSDPKQVMQIQQVANPQAPSGTFLLPKGIHNYGKPPPKPFFGPSQQSLKVPPQRIILPHRPTLSPTIPATVNVYPKITPCKTPLLPLSAILAYIHPSPSYSRVMPYNSDSEQQITTPQRHQSRPHPHYYTPQVPLTRRPHYTYEPGYQRQAPYALPAERPISQPREPPYYDPTPETEYYYFPPGQAHNEYHYHQQARPPSPYAPFPMEHQGYEYYGSPDYRYQYNYYKHPSYKYADAPMQTESHSWYMGHPQPQINPVGPRVHQTPGDYSTLPNQ